MAAVSDGFRMVRVCMAFCRCRTILKVVSGASKDNVAVMVLIPSEALTVFAPVGN